MYKNIALVALSVLVIFLFRLSIVKHPALTIADPVVITTTNTVIQLKDTMIFKKGKDIRHDSLIYVEVPISTPVDTAAILKDFFAKVVYRDTLRFSEGTVIITDIISQNRIQARAFNSKINQKTVIVTNEVTHQAKEKKGLYWGVMGTVKGNEYGFGGGLMYKTATKGIVKFEVTNNKQFQFGYYSKIF